VPRAHTMADASAQVKPAIELVHPTQGFSIYHTFPWTRVPQGPGGFWLCLGWHARHRPGCYEAVAF
jgi:hypothetical protein